MASEPHLARRLGLAAALALATALMLPAPALAQSPPSAADKETARSLMDRGDERMDAKDYAGALKAYLAADAIMKLPMTGVAVARAQAAAGQLVEARDTAMQVARSAAQPGESAAYARARAESAELANKLISRIPSIQVTVANAPAGVTVAVDGVAIPAAAALEPRKLNPGAHVVTVGAPGFRKARVEITVREGASRPVPVTLERDAGALPPSGTAPPDGPAPPADAAKGGRSPLVWIGFGVGGAGLVLGGIMGGLSIAKTGTIKDACKDGVCPASQHDAIASANTFANVSNVGIGVGLAGVALGVVGLVISKPAQPEKPAAARIEPLVGPGFIGARGSF